MVVGQEHVSLLRRCYRGVLPPSAWAGEHLAVEHDCIRAVIDERDDHVCPEASGGGRHAATLERAAELFHQGLGRLGFAGVGERGPPAAPAVGVEGELADNEGGAPRLEQREVRLAIGIAKDAQAGHLVGERHGPRAPRRRRVGRGLVRGAGGRSYVVASHAYKEQQARSDAADDLAVDLTEASLTRCATTLMSGPPPSPWSAYPACA